MSLKTKRKSRTSFGATSPPFIDYLKDILGRYPDGGQILKELIQNAEDAHATEVIFIHDERNYDTDSLWTPELGKYQGPALYAYNNEAFTEEDWKGIQMAGRSFKRNDPNKVGRFGIGFNSIYHITDVPSIFSSGRLAFMDPQEELFGGGEGGICWHWNDPDDQDILITMDDQFQPFRDIVSLVSGQEWWSIVKEDQKFGGTIFRFPLRNKASEISDNLYNCERVVDLFDSFITDADLSLLFLKHVTSVSLMHINADGEVHTRFEVTSMIHTDMALKARNDSVMEGSTRFKFITLNSEDPSITTWLVTTCTMKGGNVEALDSLAEKLSFFPQVDLAFPCGESRDCDESRLCCFLPLPDNESNKTGLPVYINACFGLTDNRRQIKWQEEDQRRDEHAIWNELLIKEVLPQAYLLMIQDAIKLAQESILPASSVYSLWPDLDQIRHRNKWYAVSLDVLQLLFTQNTAVLSLARNDRCFIPSSEAILPCNGPTSEQILDAIKNTLVRCGENLVTLPASAGRTINEAHPHLHTLRRVTPVFLRGVLHRVNMNILSKDCKLLLLEYVLSDGKYQELEGLQLLPLTDGSFRSFSTKDEDTALIDSSEFPRVLLPCCKHLFVSEDLSPDCRAHLKELARKNLFKVVNLDVHQVAEYTRRYLPKEWQQTGTATVTWDISNSQHPPLDWLQEFWKFLNTHIKELSRFWGMPLIPVGTLSVGQPVSLARLQQHTTLIFQKSKRNNLPDQIAQLVNKFGGKVVKENMWLKHEDLDSYVLCPSPRNVLKVLFNLDSQELIRELKTSSRRAKEGLKDYLSGLDSVSDKEKDLLSKLPLFQTLKGSYVAAQSKTALLLHSGPPIPANVPLPDSVVQCATEADRRLLQLLKVKLLDTGEAAILLIECIEMGSCREDTERIMTWILHHGTILFSQNQTLKLKCKDLKFIQVKGELRKTSSYFDPRVATFKVLFGSDFFPPPLYTSTPEMLKSLTDLGLLNTDLDLSPEHLLHAATLIHKLDVASHTEALKRAQVLLKLLDTNDLLSKFSPKQLYKLKTLRWVPCAESGSKYCSGKSKKSGFFSPAEMRHSMYKDIVGNVIPLVGNFSDRLASKLGLKSLPPPEKVMENLSFLKSKAETMADPDSNVDFKRELRSIYEHMQNHIPEFLAVMKNTRWLWSYNQFVSPQDLVLDYPCDLDLSYYIGKVPKEFLPYKKLLQEFGLRTSLSDKEIVSILHSIQESVDKRQPPSASSSEIKVTIEILSWLWREKKGVEDNIPVPVLVAGHGYTLKPLSTAVFCDVSKNGLNELNFNQEEIHVLHESIPKTMAEWLNIRLLSTFILDPELVGIEQCGQSEPITVRIKNILKEYDEESDIFKELIQNAEDAGADVCKFLVDFRVHKDSPESLIDPHMTLCQGPCLWAYNNEQFSDEDWKNIVSVGSASKENKVEKIGKFGLGFNTVYHVTDVPSILSGRSLLILDPNVTHLKNYIKHKTNPGIKLNLSQKRLLHCFPGQFGPYEGIFDCDFNKSPPEPYPGTLIKLPFRTEEEALVSEISTKVYHKQNIITFQQHLTDHSQTHLLFLKNINTLSLQSISKDVSTPLRHDQIETVLTVSKTTMAKMNVGDETHAAEQNFATQSLMKLDKKCKEVIDCDKINLVQITRHQSDVTEVQTWLLYNCFGTQRSLKMALQGHNQAKFALPLGGVAVPLQFDPETRTLDLLPTDLVGHAFCFLPLSIQTGLPVNLNGTFAVTSNRKGLWESGVKNDWNKALLQDPVVTAYVTVLKVLKNLYKQKKLKTYIYYTFWPDRENVSEIFKPLVDAFYAIVARNSVGPELFSDGEHWCSMNNAIFLHESIEKNIDINTIVVHMCKKYVKPPNRVVPLPAWLRSSFKQAGLKKALENKIWNWEKFYREVVFTNLCTMDPKSKYTLILHAIDLNIKEIDKLLVCYPCIPTQGDQLQYIKKLVNPTGKAASLFEPQENRLLGGTKNDFLSKKRIQRLVELGMADDRLSMEDITEKANTITKTWSTNKNKAYGHLVCLLELMKNHMNDKNSPHWETLRNTKFLPSFCPGHRETDRNIQLGRPIDMYSDNCSLLVNMTKPVLDHTTLKIHNEDPILKILGVHDSPSPKTVLQQLQEVRNQSKSIDGTTLHKIAYECYKFLDQLLIESENSSLISQTAKSFPFILVGRTFVNVSRVAENEQFEAKPYLYVLPHAFTIFKRLWDCVGVEKCFALRQFKAVLQELHSRHGKKPLPKSDLSICLTIMNTGIYGSEEEATGDLLVPNQHGVLQLPSEMYYNDTAWMSVSSSITLCHENISRVVACHLGIKTTKHHTLKNHEVKNVSPFSFQFGQQEQLTVRIRNIISAYPSKKDILKELIQNADDAEATEIHFVWDKRHHHEKRTFGEKWNSLQGPALCVFNNKVFSDADLNGIQQLGEGGKRDSPGKTGKYGVGFNSVYHLTDCPSILTGDKLLCISDPNQQFIESHSDDAPMGIGYQLADTFKNMYMDVYRTFLPDMFPLKDGTMFRLPLRMGPMANSSKISQQGVTQEDMSELCLVLAKDPEGLILFLKSICKIQVHEISEDSGEIQTIFVVEKSFPKKNREDKDAFLKLQQDALQSDKPKAPQKTIYEAIISTSHRAQSTWIVTQQFGSFKTTAEGEIALSEILPQAAVAARVGYKSSHESVPYKNFIGQAFCSLPLPGQTGLPVHVNANFEVDSSRRSLWKEDGQSIKSKWNESLKQNVIAPLYADLLHCISRNVGNKKVSSAGIDSHFINSYLCFWPTVSKDVRQDWHGMIHEVYMSIKERGLQVIPVMKSSMRVIHNSVLREYSFDWCEVTDTVKTKVPHLTNSGDPVHNIILEDLEMKLVPFSIGMQRIWSSFKAAGVEVKYVNPSSVRDFLREKPLHDPSQTDQDLPLPITATLIRDEKRFSILLTLCLSDFEKDLKNITKENSGLLDGLPLLLTKDKVLRVFDCKSPKLISEYENLFTFGYKDLFADFNTNRAHINVLKTFNLVKYLTIPFAVQYLTPAIQRLLQDCEVHSRSGLHIPSELMLKWLKLLWKFFTSQIKSETSSDDAASLTLSAVRQLFSNCCILPVVCPRLENQHLLQMMKDMPKVIQFPKENDVSGILFKLGFMKLDLVFFSDTHPERNYIHSLLQPGLMDVNDKSVVLDRVYNIDHSEFDQLSPGDHKELQRFLQEGVDKSKDKQEYQRKLKSLPLFETIHGDRVRIDGPKQVFILCSLHLLIFPDLFLLGTTTNIFLQRNLENSCLSEILKIPNLDDLEYFMRFVLPVVHTLTEKQLIQCLKLLLSPLHNFSYFEHKETIISSLKTVRLICSSKGKLEMASYYFDDSVELYKAMLPKEKFIPQRFWTELCEKDFQMKVQALTLLCNLGMKREVSKNDIRNFALQLESEAKGNGPRDELRWKSTLILKGAFAILNNEENKDKRFLESIACIEFIFPQKIREELCNYHQPLASERTAVKIIGSLIDGDPKHQDLIWTSMPIIHLPGYKSKGLMEMITNSGAHEQPPPDCLIKNMSNVCQSPCKTEDLIVTRAKVFRSMYANLQASKFDEKPLAGFPVVLVEKDTQLVKSDDVCLSLNNAFDFRPYLYNTSPMDVVYGDFFKRIGVKDKPNAAQYCNVLAAVHADSCDKTQLQPNQQKTVKRAVQQFFQLIRGQENQSHFDDVTTLYLPAADGKLYPSTTLYYNNTAFEIKRLEEALEDKFLLLEKLSECYLGTDIFEHHRLVQSLPPEFQPNMLSQLTEERMMEVNMQLCELGSNCEFRGWFETHLSSLALMHGLICLIREQSQGAITQEDAIKMCRKTFGSIQIVCCKSLGTKLWLNDQPLDETATETDVFVKRELRGCVFYLRHNNDLAPKVINDINMTLTKEINALLGNKIASNHLTVLGQLLMCDDMQDVKRALAKNGIHDSAESLLLTPPAPGTDIPEEWHDSLDMNILNNFEEGEYVGYSTNNKYIYAIIVEELPGNSGAYSRRYKIDFGKDETIEVSCVDLFQFKRQRKDTSCMQLELLTGAAPHGSSSSFPTSIEEAKREIDKCLAEIWNLPEEERHKAIKRLYLRWHPDKNPECQSLTNEAFKYLQNRINELLNGKSSSATANNWEGWNFRDFYPQWDQEARYHRRGREGFYRRNHSYNFWNHHQNVPRPNKEEAQRWCRQARCDLKAAHKDTGGGSTEWCLFKVHQAVEKSLIAAMYKRTGEHTINSSITAIAVKVSTYHFTLTDLPQMVEYLRKLGVDAKKTQYPNLHQFPHIPNGQYKQENEVLAVDQASEILSKVEAYVN